MLRHLALRCLLWLLLGLGIAGLSSPADAARLGPLEQVKSWGYQLQNLDVEKASASPHDVLVIDYSRDGSDAEALKPADLARLKQKPDGSRRVVLAYLSIGEAETYRYYWRWWWGGHWYTNWIGWFIGPRWLGEHNPDWGGNFAVRYWEAGWQSLILGKNGYLDRIIAAGFDGVWLDKVNSSIETIAKHNPSALDDMRTFVSRIAEHGRKSHPGFLVVPQNGEELLTDAAYRRVIDALGKEDLLYGEYKEKQANPERVITKRLDLLALLTKEAKPVLAVEYLDNPETIAAARQRLSEAGLTPHFADRDLGRLRYGDVPDANRGGKGRARPPKSP